MTGSDSVEQKQQVAIKLQEITVSHTNWKRFQLIP